MVRRGRRREGFADRLRSAPLVRLRNVRKVYEAGAVNHTALSGVDLDVRRGEFVAVVGKSGAGKSTLLNMVTGVDELTGGEVMVDGVAVHKLGESERAQWRGRTIGVVYQSFELLPQLSLLDNVLLPMDLCGLYRGRSSIERAQQLLDRVGLLDHIHKPPTRISGGQRQRVAIARAMANEPRIIVADEPTGNLDSVTADDIFALFSDLVREGTAILMVTHDRSLASRATRSLEIRDGVVVDRQAEDVCSAWSRGPSALRPAHLASGADD